MSKIKLIEYTKINDKFLSFIFQYQNIKFNIDIQNKKVIFLEKEISFELMKEINELILGFIIMEDFDKINVLKTHKLTDYEQIKKSLKWLKKLSKKEKYE